MGHIVCPLGVTVVVVLGGERAEVVRLAVVVPGNKLDHGEALLKNLVPAVVEESTTGEDPVLAVGDLGAEMGREPRRNGGQVGLASEP